MSQFIYFYMLARYPFWLAMTVLVVLLALWLPSPSQPVQQTATQRHDAEVTAWNLRESHDALARSIAEVAARRARAAVPHGK